MCTLPPSHSARACVAGTPQPAASCRRAYSHVLICRVGVTVAAGEPGELRVCRPSVLPSVLAAFSPLAAVTLEPARAASWLEMNFYLSGPRYEGVLPPCDFPDALVKISSRFNEKENRFWNTDLKIVSVRKNPGDGISALGGKHHPAPVLQRDRRSLQWPQARNSLFDRGGHSASSAPRGGCEWCVVGLDRNWAYNPACQMARP